MRTASHEEIGQWVRDAASAKPWRPGHNLREGPAFAPPRRADHFALIASLLDRARVKTYVRLVKPFRRLFRNQGAVNNSLIEAVYHLSQQSQEMMQEINHLRRNVISLRKQLAATTAARSIDPASDGTAETETSFQDLGQIRRRPSSCE